ncbi:MAG: glycosyltransferase family 4 protein [Acetobacteraceae bacterium]|nr:glycosyltransferase family 4 protein [Acetobacteraceae bacterium]MBV8522538.1 glycosyltransferase family 4 protein [Acetobacteraceae bacterium]
MDGAIRMGSLEAGWPDSVSRVLGQRLEHIPANELIGKRFRTPWLEADSPESLNRALKPERLSLGRDGFDPKSSRSNLSLAKAKVAPWPRVAIACSGLGHIRRGIEAWAEDLGRALLRRGAPVRLFGAGGPAPVEAVPCLPRTGACARTLAGIFRRLGGWRYGLGKDYEVEQFTFALNLWRRIRTGIDVVHIQDPVIGRLLEAARRHGLSQARVILANGTGEASHVLKSFPYLQLLTPAAAEAWEAERPPGQSVYAVPNFVNVHAYVPGMQAEARAALGLPPKGLIVLCSAAIRRYHKRVDVLLHAFAQATRESEYPVLLVVAGGRESDTSEIIAIGQELLGNRVRFLVDFPRSSMAKLYQAADLLIMPSLFETFGIVLIEAMAAGLPVLCHDNPSFRYVAGPAGHFANLADPQAFVAAIRLLLDSPDLRGRLAARARPYVLQKFSEEAVTDQILRMYREVLG